MESALTSVESRKKDHRREQPDIVLITSATGAIGSALAKSYAAQGKTLILQGRRAAELAQACNVGGAKVYVRQIDLE